MLHLPLKQTERVDLQRSLHGFVESAYSREQADEHRDAFAEVHTLRERVRQVGASLPCRPTHEPTTVRVASFLSLAGQAG